MPQRTFAFKTWAAIQIERGNLRLIAQRRRVFGAGRAVNRHQLAAHRRRKVHQAAVVAKHFIRAGEQINRFALGWFCRIN